MASDQSPPPVPAGVQHKPLDFIAIVEEEADVYRGLAKDEWYERHADPEMSRAKSFLTRSEELTALKTALSSLREAVKGCGKKFGYSFTWTCGSDRSTLCLPCERAKTAAITNLTGETTT